MNMLERTKSLVLYASIFFTTWLILSYVHTGEIIVSSVLITGIGVVTATLIAIYIECGYKRK